MGDTPSSSSIFSFMFGFWGFPSISREPIGRRRYPRVRGRGSFLSGADPGKGGVCFGTSGSVSNRSGVLCIYF